MSVSGQGRTNYGMNMRGRSMIVMVDGVRLNSSRSDSRQLDLSILLILIISSYFRRNGDVRWW